MFFIARILAGSWFQRRGPAILKALSNSRADRVKGTFSRSLDRLSSPFSSGISKSLMYFGPFWISDLWMSRSTLKTTLASMGSQWSWNSTGRMCSRFRVHVKILAAAFWTRNVHNPNKPEKLRGRSLNDRVYQDPAFDVLVRFLMHAFAVQSDIKAMYPPSQSCCFR